MKKTIKADIIIQDALQLDFTPEAEEEIILLVEQALNKKYSRVCVRTSQYYGVTLGLRFHFKGEKP